MNLLFWALTTGTLGKLILGIAVLRVHAGILHQHKIDGKVLNAIKGERYVTILGIVLILFGYILEMVFYGYTPLLTCSLSECGAAAGALFGAP
jgi:hypothetical protein